MIDDNDYYSDALDFNADDPFLDAAFDDDGLDSRDRITPRSLRRRLKQDLKKMGQRDALSALVNKLPAKGEQIHLIASGKFNFWTFVPVVSTLLNRDIEALYCGTWMVNIQSVVELRAMLDAKLVKKSFWLVGNYLKSRDPTVFYQLTEAVKDRGWVQPLETHIKIILIAAPPYFLTITGSANMSENKRLEGSQITNDKRLYEFYRDMFEEAKKNNA
ncbi:MAG: hypothetical protein IJL92_08705 [Thermoguttaceae bacterium]|nr:hypothetical protein [Thermoguttaceae bacterium]